MIQINNQASSCCNFFYSFKFDLIFFVQANNKIFQKETSLHWVANNSVKFCSICDGHSHKVPRVFWVLETRLSLAQGIELGWPLLWTCYLLGLNSDFDFKFELDLWKAIFRLSCFLWTYLAWRPSLFLSWILFFSWVTWQVNFVPFNLEIELEWGLFAKLLGLFYRTRVRPS